MKAKRLVAVDAHLSRISSALVVHMMRNDNLRQCQLRRPNILIVVLATVILPFWYALLHKSFDVSRGSMQESTPPVSVRPLPNVLIAQYKGEFNVNNTSYSQLLNLTSRVNQAYADVWGFDYIVESGYMILKELGNESTAMPIRESMATYNKIMILEKVLTEPEFRRYDTLVLLDADALIFDFKTNVATALLPPDKMFTALQVGAPRGVKPEAHNVNIGVTLWNLRHPNITAFVEEWKRDSVALLRLGVDEDQAPLQMILYRMNPDQRDALVHRLNKDEISYSHAKIIKHFIRPDGTDWSSPLKALLSRVKGIRKATKKMCRKTFSRTQHPAVCTEYFENYGWWSWFEFDFM
jgi:hypothetical protein